MTEHENREYGALTFEEARRVAFAEEGVTSYDDSGNPTLHTDRRACPFRSLRLIIQKHFWRDSTSEMDITEPFPVFPGVFLVTRLEEGRDQAIRELFIPRRKDNHPVPGNPFQNVNIPVAGPPYTWTFAQLTVPQRSGAYDVLESTVDFFNYLAGVGTYPNVTALNADFFGDRFYIVRMFDRVIKFLNNPFEAYAHDCYFKYYFEVGIVATRGVIDNFISNLNNVSDAQVRQSDRDFRMEIFQVRLVRASDGRVFYFQIIIRLRTIEFSYSISIVIMEDSSSFDTADINGIENAMSNAASPPVNNPVVGGGGVGSLVVFNTLFDDRFNLRLSVVLDELERSVNKL